MANKVTAAALRSLGKRVGAADQKYFQSRLAKELPQ